MVNSGKIFFSKFVVTPQVFYKTKYTYALVNLKPIVPGHVLIIPLRVVPRLKDLTTEESIDYMMTLQLVHKVIEKVYKADSLNIAIQDGPESGQSVAHLHTHIIPRYRADSHGDAIYDKVEKTDFERDLEFSERRKSFKQNGKFETPHDDDRVERTMETMENEALWLAREIQNYQTEIST